MASLPLHLTHKQISPGLLSSSLIWNMKSSTTSFWLQFQVANQPLAHPKLLIDKLNSIHYLTTSHSGGRFRPFTYQAPPLYIWLRLTFQRSERVLSTSWTSLPSKSNSSSHLTLIPQLEHSVALQILSKQREDSALLLQRMIWGTSGNTSLPGRPLWTTRSSMYLGLARGKILVQGQL